MIPRRRALGGLGALLSAALSPAEAGALARPIYGGTARLTLPIDTSRIDPHDSGSLTACLLGASLFDGLYAKAGTLGPAYPTLAAARSLRKRSAVLGKRAASTGSARKSATSAIAGSGT